MKKFLCVLLVALLLTGCNAPAQTTEPTEMTTEATTSETTLPLQPQYTVGLSMPDEALCQELATGLQSRLQAMDCTVVLRYADGDAQTQLTQLEELIALQADCLVVTAVDSVMIAQTLDNAKAAGIPVLAWDGLLMETEGVHCCVAPDYRAMGAAMGQSVVQHLALDGEDPLQRSYSVEFFMGPAEDYRAFLLHSGLMEVLEPYLAAGVLACRSGRLSFEDTSVSKEEARTAKWQSSALFQQYYEKDLRPDVIFTGGDILAEGCIQALTELGCNQENWPLITGQGTGTMGVRRVVSGKQLLTMWIDAEAFLQTTAETVGRLLAGEEVATDYTLHNHIVDVPVIYCGALEINKGNYERLLIETGIYTRSQLKE